MLLDKLFLNKLSESDVKRWQSAEGDFRQVRLNYNNRIKKQFCQSQHGSNLYDRNQINDDICTQINSLSTTTTITPISISKSVTVDGDDSKQLEDIRQVCDQFRWTVVVADSNVFRLSKYLELNQIICSISDIDPDVNYRHMCQDGR